MASLLAEMDTAPLSTLLQRALRVAREHSDAEFEHWIRLELNGYVNTNPALTEADVVPVYRTVVGQHADDLGQVLRLTDHRMGFVNETRVRWSVPELEDLYRDGGWVSTYDPKITALIRENLGVEVTQFRFDTRQLSAVFAAIRAQLAESLEKYERRHAQSVRSVVRNSDDEIIELKPNFAGIGINLRALWRAVQAWWRRRSH